MIFFQFLVVVLNESADDVGRLRHGLWWKIFVRVDALIDLVITKHHALQDAMFAHQVFISGDIIFRSVLLLGKSAHTERGSYAFGGCKQQNRTSGMLGRT